KYDAFTRFLKKVLLGIYILYQTVENEAMRNLITSEVRPGAYFFCLQNYCSHTLNSATRLPSTDSENQKVTDSMADMNVNPATSNSSSTLLPFPSASPVKIEDEASPTSSSADAKLPETDDSAAAPPAKKPKKRCGVCKKKLGLTGFECRCGLLFCGVHRYSDKHDCSFDYKENGRAELSKLNPVCAGEKINKL
ncbi:unnamed protein product, partial [Oikopleura dioica]